MIDDSYTSSIGKRRYSGLCNLHRYAYLIYNFHSISVLGKEIKIIEKHSIDLFLYFQLLNMEQIWNRFLKNQTILIYLNTFICILD